MTSIVFALPGNEATARHIAEGCGFELGTLEARKFPDDETYLRYRQAVAGRSVILVCTLDRPDAKFLPLILAADSARELGASRTGLVAPYLAYMRQDSSFHEGEAVTSALFARLISEHFDWLVTVDPHLHRIHALEEIYTVPSHAVHAAPLLAAWIKAHVTQAVVIGPDAESTQWAGAIAHDAGAPLAVLEKTRRGDHDVSVSLPDSARWSGFVPVLVDDIVSTGRTMIAAAAQLLENGMGAPVCIAIHPIFATDALRELRDTGVRQIISTNTITHETNAIDVTPLLVPAIRQLVQS